MSPRISLIFSTAVICFFLVGSVHAEDTQVNTYTTNSQSLASISSDADGNFVVVWRSPGSSGTDTDLTSVQGRRYASDDSPRGGEFQINTYTTTGQETPSVSMDADGDFVVVWQSLGSSGTDTDSWSIQGQRYASDGNPRGGEFQINTYTTDGQTAPTVSMDADGDFVAVWRSDGSGGTDTDTPSIQGRRYASDGNPVGGQFQINSYTTDSQANPVVALNADGDLAVVVWNSLGSSGTDTSLWSVQGQRFGSTGSPAGGEFQINIYTTDTQSVPSVSMEANGDFVVVWRSGGSGGTDTSQYSVQGRRYSSDGNPVGGEFQVNRYTTGNQQFPSVSMDADGDFVVAWQSDGDGFYESTIQSRRYASNGAAMGGEYKVNTYTDYLQILPAASVDADGDFVVVWQSYGSSGTDSDSDSIQKSDAEPVLLLFEDGFETGDLSAWSGMSPSW